MATLGVSLGHCDMLKGSDLSPRLQQSPQNIVNPTTQNNTYEIGLGIHNEPGIAVRPLAPVTTVVGDLLEALSAPLSSDGSTPFVVAVNNLGGLSNLELNIITKEVTDWLRNKGINIAGIVVGSLMTALNMPGFSVTLLGSTEETLRLLKAPTECRCWPGISTVNQDCFYTPMEWVTTEGISKGSKFTGTDCNTHKFKSQNITYNTYTSIVIESNLCCCVYKMIILMIKTEKWISINSTTEKVMIVAGRTALLACDLCIY